MKSKANESWFIKILGNLSVTVLCILPHLPEKFLEKILQPFLLVYPAFRKKHIKRMEDCWKALPFKNQLTIRKYYQSRLRIFLKTLAEHEPKSQGKITEDLIKGERHYKEALEENRPIILLGLHLGLFENLHRLPTKPAARPFGILTTESFSESLTKYMAQGREQDGKRVILRSNFSNEVKKIIRQRGILAMMVDQNPEAKSEENSLLLWNKISICYPRRILELAMRNNFLILPVSTIEKNDSRCGIEFDEPWTFAEGKFSREIIKEKVRNFLEKNIEGAPELWNWSYGKVSVLNRTGTGLTNSIENSKLPQFL